GVGWLRWDVRTGRQERFGPRGKGAGRSAVSPDAKWVAVAGPRRVRVFDAATGKVARTFRVKPTFGLSVAWFTADGKELFAWGAEGLRVWDLATGKHRDVEIPGGELLSALDVSPDATRVAVGVR